jgi:predicted phosphoribosyltransferase
MRQRLVSPYRVSAFSDRVDAGRQLAQRLEEYRGPNTLVLGIPRGGVPVAAEVARYLDADLDVLVARKLGAPGAPELAIGAVTANGGIFLNDDLLRELHVSATYLDAVVAAERAEAHRREERFRGTRAKAAIAGRTVILVDDGLATGATMRAAVRSVRRGDPGRLIVAVPVGAPETCAILRSEADDVVCLQQPEPFFAVGLHYRRFDQTTDDEVQQLLAAAHERRAAPQPRAS